MKASIRSDGELLEEISVKNGLRQGCCMHGTCYYYYLELVIMNSGITIREVRRRRGDDETASTKVAKRRLQWLGHLGRMLSAHVQV